ncbi:hypothetical protein HDV06_006776 [Boothiomyces sp. JEL0866]|nr:hypothetical protein HDV06_006776 [Boothiomyces sp. JEL0866]
MATNLFLDVLIVTIYSFILTATIYYTYVVNTRQATLKKFTIEFNLVLLFNVIQTLDVLCLYLLRYLVEDQWVILFNSIFNFSGIVGNIQLLMIAIIDIEILRVFGILDENITEFKLKLLKRANILLFIMGFITSIIPLFMNDTFMSNLSDITLGIFAMFVVVYDNIQSFYLVRLIYRYKRQKLKNHEHLSGMAKVTRQIFLILASDWSSLVMFLLALADISEYSQYFINLSTVGVYWISLGSYAISEIVGNEYSNVIANFSTVGMCVHSLAVIFILRMLVNLSIQKNAKIDNVTRSFKVCVIMSLSIRVIELDIPFMISLTGLLLLSTYYFYQVNSRKAVAKSFVMEFNCLIGVNILQSLLILSWFVIYYINIDVWGKNDHNIMLLSGLIITIQVCLIFVIDVEILRIFSILNDNISDRKLNIFKICGIASFTIVFAVSFLPLVISSDQILNVASAVLGIYAALVIIYDNLQIFYLAFLIFNYKKIKAHAKLEESLIKGFRKVVRVNILVLTMDWAGLFFYMINVVGDSGYSSYFSIAGLICCCLHGLVMVHILQQFAKLSVQKKKAGFPQVLSAPTYHINFRKTAVKSFIILFNFLLFFNAAQCALLLTWVTLYYTNNAFWYVNDSNIIQIGGVIVSLQLFVIFLTDIEILRVFSILNENITNSKLNWARRVVFVLYLIVLVYAVIPIYITDDATASTSNILLGIFAVMVALYDNIQTAYLGYLIFGYKKSKTKTDPSMLLVKEFKEIIRFNGMVVLMDWVGLVLYSYSTVDDSEFSTYYAVASLICSCIHTLGMVKILEMFAKVSVQKKKRKPKIEDTFQVE